MPQNKITLIQNMFKFIAFILDLLGFKYIWYKLNPSKRIEGSEPRTITLWLISIMVALYSIASSRYEQELTRLEYRVSNLIMQAESSDNVLSFIPKLQNRKIPYKPSILNPLSTIKSFFSKYDIFDDDLVDELQDTIIKKKHKLKDLNLNLLSLADKDLSYANFQFSNLNNATFYQSNLVRSNFKYTNLVNTNFKKSYLFEANFSYSNLAYTDFYGTNLRNTDFSGASIYMVHFENALIVGANFKNTDLTNIRSDFMKGAKYNSKNITLNKVSTFWENHILCLQKYFKQYQSCLYDTDKEIVPPTQFPEGFNPKAHGMIDVSEDNLN